jgi:2-haloacid dehalogenase
MLAGGLERVTEDAIDFGRFEALTFDCYGTLIDWETGIVAGLRRALGDLPITPSDDELLERFGRAESSAEAGPYLRYREILARCLLEVSRHFGVEPSAETAAAFGASVADWPAFPDSAAALELLKARFRLGVITNCDDDLFASSAARLGTSFDWVVTAQSVGSYKPDPRNFTVALERIGLPRERILHVAQSLFHDHVPAKRLGFSTVWIDRRHDRPGFGATPPADVQPDATYPDLAAFAAAAAGT